MPEFNMLAIAISGLVPLVVGYIWYHPKVMGSVLSKEVHSEGPKKSHHPLVYGLTFLFSILISMLIAAIFSTHAIEDQTMSHGAFHGLMASIFMGIPTFAVIAMFENKSIKYIFIHAIYWAISFTIMGTIIGGM